MRTFFRVTLVAVSLAAVALPAIAEPAWRVKQPTRFVVSGVLLKDGTTDVIKPAHSIIEAETGEGAAAKFAEMMPKQFPGYRLISTLASPVPMVGACRLDI